MTGKKLACRPIPVFLLVAMIACGCVRFVADYDAALESHIVATAKKVDVFYRTMAKTPDAKRTFDAFREQYFQIETELNSLMLQQKTKPLNAHSVRITEIALTLFLEDKKNHEKADTFKPILITRHNAQLQKVFVAMANAEAAKKLVDKE